MKKVLICLMALMASIYGWGTVNSGDEYTLSNSNKTLTIHKSGDWASGVMTTYNTSSNTSPWYGNSTITKIIIEEGITHLGAYTFYGCSNLAEIHFPPTITSIGSGAFTNCSKTTEIHVSTPNQWAQISLGNQTANPFGATGYDATTKAARGFCFYGNNTKSRALVFAQGLDSIRQYTFVNAHYFTSAYIPSSVSRIGTSALTCLFDTVVVNKMNRPILKTSSTISFNNPSVLIVPTGAENFTIDRWWMWSTSSGKNSYGARDKKEKDVSGTVDGQSWILNTDGVLTISGSGALTTSFVKADGSTQYPYYYFRYLVDKVVVTGGITALSNILQRCEAVQDVDIDQAKMPSASATLPTLIHGGTIALNVNPAALADASASNLGTTPWTDAKFGNVTLSSAVSIADNAECETLLANIHNYVEEPFDMNVTRSMSNAYYNTFCSPIDMNSTLVESIFGAGTKIYSFAGTSYTEETDELSLNFNESQNYIDAGVPYLIWPAKNVSNPSFTNVNPSDVATSASSVAGTHATFYGTLAPVDVSSAQIDAKSFIFLQANNTLNWASEGTLNGMRAYWLLTGNVPARALARRPVMKIGQSTTAIESVQTSDIRSQKNMRNGQIYIVRGEQMYNAQGQMIK